MKQLFILIAICCSCACIIAQPVKKKADKLPSKAETDAMMKQMEEAMKDLDPEAKRMMDSMGIQLPDTKKMQKTLSGVSSNELETAWEDENRIVPKKDITRIASVSKTPLTTAAIPAFVAMAHQKVSSKMKAAAKTKGDEIYAIVKATTTQPTTMANAAAGLWMIGKTQIAIYLMGRACADDPDAANSLSNYASMLTMAGMEETAIPLLNNLNGRYPQNSTILNNIGQAWYGLGDMERAGKYIDSTLRFAALHPQANATKSAIEESKGNTPGAKDAAIKAIKEGYSKEKEERLQKLDIAVDDNTIDWPFPNEKDAFGLSDFKRPDYPQTVSQCITAAPVWAVFKKQCGDEEERLMAQLKTALEAAQKAAMQRINKAKQQMKYLQQNPTADVQSEPAPLYFRKATLQLQKADEFWQRKYEEHGEKWAAFVSEVAKLKEEYEANIAILAEQDLEQTGEGKPNIDFCPRYAGVANTFLTKYNTALQKMDVAFLEILKRQANEIVSLKQFTEWPEDFEVTKLQWKALFLGKLKEANYQSITRYHCMPSKSGQPTKLAEFDDVHCQYHDTMNLVVEKITIDCGRMTTEINTPFLKLNLKQDMNKETFGDQFMNFSVEISAAVGPSANIGPLKAEAKIRAGVRAEFDRTGMTDFIVKGAATVGTKVKSEGVGVGVKVGVEAQVSLITGKTSVGGAGLFKK